MGRHRSTSRIRLSHAVAAAAAAVCLSPQASAAPRAAPGAAHRAAVPGAASKPAPLPPQVVSATRRALEDKAGSTLPAWYTVRAGDSLSGIAGRFYRNQSAWPVIYWRNHGQIRWANIIRAGLALRIPAKPGKVPGAPALLDPPARAPGPAPAVAGSAPQQASPAEAPAPADPVRAPVQAAAAADSGYSGGTRGSAFSRCVVSRESGGDSRAMNSSGHYGLYQFSASTWAAYGGNPGDFGNASVSEQNQVFANALARGGQSNWSAYDGC